MSTNESKQEANKLKEKSIQKTHKNNIDTVVNIANLKIIGTSHIAKESMKNIRDYTDENDVNLICIELDKERLYGLIHNINTSVSLKNIGMIRQIGFSGFIFALIASIMQKKLGRKVNLKPGSDMLAAVKVAHEKKINLALIDQNVQVTLRNLSLKMKFIEKLRVVGDIIKGLLGFKSELIDVDMKKMDLSKVPSEELIYRVIKKTRSRYPGFYQALIEDRNVFMSKKILRFMTKNPHHRVLAVVGAGHKEGMVEYIEAKLGQSYKD